MLKSCGVLMKLHAQLLHVICPKLVIYSLNFTNPFVTRPGNRARLAIYPRNSKNAKLMQISIWMLDRAHTIAATERISF